MKTKTLFASALAVLGLTACEKGLVDEDGSSTSGNDNNGGSGGDTQNFPSVGDTYQGCYVLAVTVEDDGQSAELVLRAPSRAAYPAVF